MTEASIVIAALMLTSCGLHGMLEDFDQNSSSSSEISSNSRISSSSINSFSLSSSSFSRSSTSNSSVSNSSISSSSVSSSSISSSSISSSSVYYTPQGDKGNDINNYKIVEIGSQTWMAENMNYKTENSVCYGEGGKAFNYNEPSNWEDSKFNLTLSAEEIQANCNKYGRLYDWATAMALDSTCNRNSCASQVQRKHRGICPGGWHIPTKVEYDTLMKYVERDQFCSNCVGLILKAKSGWRKNEILDGNGSDHYGFAALPGGYGYSDDGDFSSEGRNSYWWSSSDDNDQAFSLRLSDDYDGYTLSLRYKIYLRYSVRCIKD